jgi:tripartite-type tricarboxylate transporter receptor subunit TctC
MFKTMAGVDLFHVPYRGAQVFPALLTGEAQVYFGPLLSSIWYIRTGNFRPLAVTTVARSPILPDVPALDEILPGYEASAWFGIGGPKRTPEEVIEKLNKAVNSSIADPKLQAQLATLGGTALGGSPAELAKLISDEVKKWSRVILAANMKREWAAGSCGTGGFRPADVRSGSKREELNMSKSSQLYSIDRTSTRRADTSLMGQKRLFDHLVGGGN